MTSVLETPPEVDAADAPELDDLTADLADSPDDGVDVVAPAPIQRDERPLRFGGTRRDVGE